MNDTIDYSKLMDSKILINRIASNFNPPSFSGLSAIDYAEKFVYISTEDNPPLVIPYKRNSVQSFYHNWKEVQPVPRANGKRIIVLKSRRMGITTYEQSISYSECRTQRKANCLTVAQTDDATTEIFRMVKFMHDNDINKAKTKQDSKGALEYRKLASKFSISSAESTAIQRGSTLTRAHCSEIAFWNINDRNAENLISAISEATRQGEFVLETTANGVGGFFYDLWMEAISGNSMWTPCFLGWYLDPRNSVSITQEESEKILETLDDEEVDLIDKNNVNINQLAWRRLKRVGSERKKKMFDQEYPSDAARAFISSGGSYFDVDKILSMIPKCKKPIYENSSGLTIWKEPEANHKYIVAADTSEGNLDSDPSPIVILDWVTGEQVYRLNWCVKPNVLGRKCVELAKKYNGAIIAVENNNTGHSAINTIMNQECYSNLFIMDGAESPGWRTDARTRPILLSDLDDGLLEDTLCVNDALFLQQCMAFKQNSAGKYESARGSGHHGDLIIAWGIANQVKILCAPKNSNPIFV